METVNIKISIRDKNINEVLKVDNQDKKEKVEKETEKKEAPAKKEKQVSNNAILGKWREVSYSKEYLNFIKTEFPDDYQNFDHRYKFNKDGTFEMYHVSGGWKYHGIYEKTGDKWLATFHYHEDEGKTDVILKIENNQLIFKYNYDRDNDIIYLEKF